MSVEKHDFVSLYVAPTQESFCTIIFLIEDIALAFSTYRPFLRIMQSRRTLCLNKLFATCRVWNSINKLSHRKLIIR